MTKTELELYEAAQNFKRFFPEMLTEQEGGMAGADASGNPNAPVQPPQGQEQGAPPAPEGGEEDLPGNTPKEEEPVDEKLKGKLFEFIAEYGEVNDKLLTKYSDFEEYDPKQVKAALRSLKDDGKINSKKIWYAVVQNDLEVETDEDGPEDGIDDSSVEDTSATQQPEAGADAGTPMQPPQGGAGAAQQGQMGGEAPAMMPSDKKKEGKDKKRKMISDIIDVMRDALDQID